MLPLREFHTSHAGFPSLINYFSLVDDSILLLKDGSYLRCFEYRGPDMDSCEAHERDILAARINQALLGFGTGWLINVDAIRTIAASHPNHPHYPDATSQLIEQERAAGYQQEGTHFESRYVLSLTYKPNFTQRHGRLSRWFIKRDQVTQTITTQVDEAVEYVRTQTDRLLTDLSAFLYIRVMESQELLSFLHYCITAKQQSISVPTIPHYLNYLLGAYDFIGGTEPSIDGRPIVVVSVAGFPQESFSGMLEAFSHLACECRFSSRFICMDARDATKTLTQLRTKLHMRQTSVSGTVMQSLLGNSVPAFANEEASSKTDDANDAINEAREGYVRYGYYTACFVFVGSSLPAIYQEANHVRHLLENKGFIARIETLNAVEAYLGSLPGHAYPNVRKPIIHTVNLAHLLPLTTLWAGRLENPNPMFGAHRTPLFHAATTGHTPFRFHLHVSDVGHSLILGPTGAGKSTLLALIAAQFFKYPHAQVFVFDKGMSHYALAKACGADHYAVMAPHQTLGLSPLAQVDQPSERMWAVQWLEELLVLQGVAITPAHRQSLAVAVDAMSIAKQRTLTECYTNLQDKTLKEALAPFVLVKDGIMAQVLDADTDGLGNRSYQVFETDHLMQQDKRYSVPVLTYLFHRIEQRLDGRPTLIILDEAWHLLSHDLFREKIRQWLKVLRKANAAVVFATQSLSDVMQSSIKDVIMESCPTKIFLPNVHAATPTSEAFYQSMGLNQQQIHLISQALPKRHYYYTSPEGQRLIELALGKVALAFLGVSSPKAIQHIKQLEATHGEQWPSFYLLGLGLDEQAKEWQQWHAHKTNQSADILALQQG